MPLVLVSSAAGRRRGASTASRRREAGASAVASRADSTRASPQGHGSSPRGARRPGRAGCNFSARRQNAAWPQRTPKLASLTVRYYSRQPHHSPCRLGLPERRHTTHSGVSAAVRCGRARALGCDGSRSHSSHAAQRRRPAPAPRRRTTRQHPSPAAASTRIGAAGTRPRMKARAGRSARKRRRRASRDPMKA